MEVIEEKRKREREMKGDGGRCMNLSMYICMNKGRENEREGQGNSIICLCEKRTLKSEIK